MTASPKLYCCKKCTPILQRVLNRLKNEAFLEYQDENKYYLIQGVLERVDDELIHHTSIVKPKFKHQRSQKPPDES